MRPSLFAAPALLLRLALAFSLLLSGLPLPRPAGAVEPEPGLPPLQADPPTVDPARDAFTRFSGSVNPLLENEAARRWLAQQLPAEFRTRFPEPNQLSEFLRTNPRLAAELLYASRGDLSRAYSALPATDPLKSVLRQLLTEQAWRADATNPWGSLQDQFRAWAAAQRPPKDVNNPEHFREFLRGMSPQDMQRAFHPTAPLGAPPRPADRQPGVDGSNGSHRFDWDPSRFNRLIFNSSEIYGRPGEPHVWSGADSSGRRRVFSMQLIDVSGGHHQGAEAPITRLSVTDITDPANPVQFTVPLNDPRIAAGEAISPEGITPFTIKNDGGRFSLSVAGVNWSQPGQAMSLDQMHRYRAERVRSYGYVVSVGGREYYLFAQGHGDQTNLTYWDVAQLDRALGNSNATASDFRPSMVSSAVRKRVDGVDQRQDVVHIGEVGGKWQALKWDGAQGKFKVTDTLSRPAPPPVTPGPGGPGTTPAGGPGARYSSGVDAGWPDLSGVGTPLTPVADLNSRLDASVRDQVHFYRGQNGDMFFLLNKEPIPYSVPAGMRPEVFVPPNAPSGQGGYVLVLEDQRAGNVSYWDLRRLQRGPDGGLPQSEEYQAGTLSASGTDTNYSKIKDPAILRHALGRANWSPDDINRALEAAAAMGGPSASQQLNGNQTYFIVNGRLYRRGLAPNSWETVDPSASGSVPPPGGQTSTHRMDVTVAQAPRANWNSAPIAGATTITLPGTSAAINVSQAPNVTSANGTGMIYRTADTPPRVIIRVDVVHNNQGNSNPADDVLTRVTQEMTQRLPGVDVAGARFTVQGLDLTGRTFTGTLAVTPLVFEDGRRGVIGLTAGGGGNNNNLLGIVGYWGYGSEAEARAAGVAYGAAQNPRVWLQTP